jgi:hypothetical protein
VIVPTGIGESNGFSFFSKFFVVEIVSDELRKLRCFFFLFILELLGQTIGVDEVESCT